MARRRLETMTTPTETTVERIETQQAAAPDPLAAINREILAVKEAVNRLSVSSTGQKAFEGV